MTWLQSKLTEIRRQVLNNHVKLKQALDISDQQNLQFVWINIQKISVYVLQYQLSLHCRTWQKQKLSGAQMNQMWVIAWEFSWFRPGPVPSLDVSVSLLFLYSTVNYHRHPHHHHSIHSILWSRQVLSTIFVWCSVTTLSVYLTHCH